MARSLFTAFLLVLFTLASGCKPERSDREMLVEAAMLEQQGQFEDAREIYTNLYERSPGDVNVLIAFSAFLIDREELESSRELLDRLEEAELSRNDQGRFENELRRYWQAMYTRARGSGPASPADPDTYEQSIIALLNLDRNSPVLQEWRDYLTQQTRIALGGPAEEPLAYEAEENAATRATADRARDALSYLIRLLEGDERLSVMPILDEALRAEMTSVRPILERTVFESDFDGNFAHNHRPAMVRASRFDTEREVFTIHWEGPLANGLGADATAELLLQQAETWYAREIATDLAFELLGEERRAAEPIAFDLSDLRSVVATNVVLDVPASEESDEPDAEAELPVEPPMIGFDLEIPYETVRYGAYLLSLRLAEEAERAELETGDEDVEGSGE